MCAWCRYRNGRAFGYAVVGLLLSVHVGHVCEEPGQDLVVVLEERLPLVEGIDLGHVLVRQHEIEQVDVLSDVRRRPRARDHDVSLLDMPTQQYLGGGLAMPAERVSRLQRDIVCGLELAITGNNVSRGLVQDHEVDVVDAQSF